MKMKLQLDYVSLLLSLFRVTICSNQILILSFDGFRYDYYGLVPTPNIDFIVKNGVHAKDGVKTVYASKTLPAHYSIATGLYEESHGIIDNKIYDPVFNESFRYGGPEKWWGGEPIWVTARKQGKTVGTFFWPGSDLKRKDGLNPNYSVVYNGSINFEERINAALRWLIEKKLDLVMLYINEPDHAGHKFGAASEAVKKALVVVDKLIGTVISKLNSSKLLDTTNLIILSDHGMTNTTTVTNLTKYISIEKLKSFESSAIVSRIEPYESDVIPVYEKLKSAKERINVYLKQDIPERLHYKHNRRVKSILVMPKEGNLINKEWLPPGAWGIRAGDHGFDNDLLSMRAIFAAKGPAFKNSFNVRTFELVDYYELLCHLLHIQPAPNNGSMERVKPLLKSNVVKLN